MTHVPSLSRGFIGGVSLFAVVFFIGAYFAAKGDAATAKNFIEVSLLPGYFALAWEIRLKWQRCQARRFRPTVLR